VMERSMKLMKNAVETNRNILVSVNVSVAFLLSSNFVSIVKSALKSTGFPAANLVVEVTENLFISSLEVATEVLFKLKELGIKIALDDFGTGFASLSYLHSLPIDILKIDKSFVDSLNDDKDDGFITAIISMGHMLDCSIVAEGVETQAQYDKLKKYGCDIIQGFLLGKPTSYENAMEICKKDLLD
ncbi:MAG: EAL domain-containing protein, partial [Ruminococcus sp.]|nr:EAL domain-containing protein [Ruminococcus sp.]